MPSLKTEQELTDFATIIRETFLREPGKNVVTFSDILTFFGEDRVPASAFLTANGWAVETIDGEQRIVEGHYETP